MATDEAFLVQNAAAKYVRGRTGTGSVAAYGNRASVSVFGCVLGDGRQLFLTFTGRFKSEQFAGCPDAMRRKSGRVVVLYGRWGVHVSDEAKERPGEHRYVKIISMPMGSPHPSVAGACWNRGGYGLPGSNMWDSRPGASERVWVLQDGRVCAP